MSSRRGVSTTEYLILISVIVVGLAAAAIVFQIALHTGVDALAQDVKVLLEGGGNEAVAGREGESSCPYVFDPRTGRYHDTSDGGYLMVAFSDAHEAGCD